MKTKINVVMFAFFAIAMASVAFAADKIPHETEISGAWCKKNKGIAEFYLLDKSRVDCYAPKIGYAVEFDWANKHAPYTCIGQARFYAAETGLNPMCILIRRPDQTHKHFRKHTRKALIGGGATIRCITVRGERIDCLTGEIQNP